MFVVGNSRVWILRVAVGTRTNSEGKTVVHRRDIGLGSYPEVSLAEARDKARELRKQVKSGIDPLEQKKRNKEALCKQQRNTKTFRECAEVVMENKARELKNVHSQKEWRRTVEMHVLPALGDRNVGSITTADVADVLKPLWVTKYKTAITLRGRIEAILDYAKAMKYRDGENPAAWKGVLKPILGKIKYKVDSYPALPYVDVGAFMAELRKREGMASRALELIVLTATREGEVLGAVWEEFDMTAKIWTIPAERMKSGKEHRIPLSEGAMKLLESLPRMPESKYVFPWKTGSRIHRATVRRLIWSMHEADVKAGGKGYTDPKQKKVVTVHGFRSTFRDWAGETTTYPSGVCEHALAHKLIDKVEAAYQRGDMLVKRTQLMADWSEHCGTIQNQIAKAA